MAVFLSIEIRHPEAGEHAEIHHEAMERLQILCHAVVDGQTTPKIMRQNPFGHIHVHQHTVWNDHDDASAHLTDIMSKERLPLLSRSL